MEVKLIAEGTSPDPIKAMAIAASKCYDSKPTEKLVHKVLKSGHTSIAENAKFEFDIKGVSRVLSHQLVRKRIGFSYAQRSQRYINEDGFDYVTPGTINENKDALFHFNDVMKYANRVYNKLINKGVPKEDARFVLPNATHTTLVLSCNLRSLMDFCEERLCTRAQWEIRELAAKLKEEIKNNFSPLEKYLIPKCERLEFCPEHKSCGHIK